MGDACRWRSPITGAGALVLGLLTVRLSGHYLPLGTIAWGLSLYFLFGELELFHRHDGITAIPPFNFAGWDLYDSRGIYYLIWAFVILAAVATHNLLNSRTGRAIRALRGGGIAAESFGVSTMRVKLIVFVYAALLAGVSGWLYAHMQRAVNQTPFGINAGIEYLLMAVLGGAGHVGGAILGAGIVTLLKDQLQRILPAAVRQPGQLRDDRVRRAAGGAAADRARGAVAAACRARAGAGQAAAPAGGRAAAGAARCRPPASRCCRSNRRARSSAGSLPSTTSASTCARGEIVGLIGPNGAGKSTIFNLVTGVLWPTVGRDRLQGRAHLGAARAGRGRRGIARTFQHVKILPNMSVLENVALGAHLRGAKGAFASVARLDRARGGAAARRGGAADRAHGARRRTCTGPPAACSLGQLRIVEIARALCLDPVLLLLDEPAAGLRHLEKRELAETLDPAQGGGAHHPAGRARHELRHGPHRPSGRARFRHQDRRGAPAEVRADPVVIEAYLGGVV